MRTHPARLAVFGLLVLPTIAMAQQVGPLPDIARGDLALHLKPIVTGISAPDYGISPPGDTHRLFVVEQKGLLLVVKDGALLPTPALDVQSRVAPPLVPSNANDERGLLGLAFSPGFADPAHVGYRTLYTYSGEPIPAGTSPTYAAPNGAAQNYKLVVNEYRMSATDPDVVDPTTRREVVSFGKTAGNHNGGTLAFGPDGYLYLALGDGGNANDVGASHIEPGGNAQNLTTPLGKMLRFDPNHPSRTPTSGDAPSTNGEYRIPATNPFPGGLVPEIYAYGLRNPYRFSFDRANGELILADVGQNNIEEINRITLGGNYGWAVKEGDFLFNRADGTIGARSPGMPVGMIDPIAGALGTLEYDHSDGISITGGFVYRGSDIPALVGKYVFGDLAIRGGPRVDGRLFYADLASGEILEFRLPLLADDMLPDQLTVHGFGEDGNGELTAMVTNTPSNGTGGIVYQLAPVIPIEFTLKSDALKLGQGGPPRLTASLEPPAPYTLDDIDLASIRLDNFLPLDAPGSVRAGDQDHDGIPDLKVTFASSALEDSLGPGDEAEIKVTGLLGEDAAFEGYDTILLRGRMAATSLHPVDSEVHAVGLAFPRPNPSNGAVQLGFTLATAGEAEVAVFDLKGRRVAELARGSYPAGATELRWNGLRTDGTRAESGLYFVRMKTEAGEWSRRLVRID